MKLKKIALAVLISISVSPSFLFAQEQEIKKDEEYFKNMKSMIQEKYEGDITQEELIQGAINGMFDALDKHSMYMNKEEANEFQSEGSGKYYGVGARLSVDDGKLKVLEVFEESPAHSAGLLPGDIVSYIEKEKIENLKTIYPIIPKIRGEKDSTLNVTVLRNGKEIKLSMKRAEFEEKNVEYKLIDEKIGYIKIRQFAQNSYRQTREAIRFLKSKNIEKVVLDLRGNPGGSLAEVYAIGQKFLNEGDYIIIKHKGELVTELKAKDKPQFQNVAVLINEDSASASEILSGSIQDMKTGILIGKTTYGKGSVQNLYPLINGEAFKITTNKYYLPSGRSIEGVGVKPDIEIERFLDQKRIEKIPPIEENTSFQKDDIDISIVAIQEMLDIMKYKITDKKGYFGISTQGQIKQFQKDFALEVTGVADIKTCEKLKSKFKEYLIKDDMDAQLQKAIEVLKK